MKAGDKYYYINEWMVVNFRKWKGSTRDIQLMAMHNHFLEKTAAEAAAKEIQRLLFQYNGPVRRTSGWPQVSKVFLKDASS